MTTVQVDDSTLSVLNELASRTGEPVPGVLARAVEAYRRRAFLEDVNNDFSTLRRDAEAWRFELEERAIWDRTLADGLDARDAVPR